MTRWILWLAGVPAAAGLAVVAVGAMLPRDHVAAVETRVTASPEQVAALIRDVEGQPKWRSSVTAIEVVERRETGLRYVERSGGDAITFDFREEAPGRQFRSTISDPELPFGGFWILTLTPDGGGTRLRIEEQGFVTNPIYRFFSALVFGHKATMRGYLEDLARAVNGATSAPSA